MACLMQYKAMRHRITGSGKFTAAEEQKIQEAVAKHGHNWGAVAGHVGGGRNRQQVMHHYYNVMKAEAQVPRKLGKWSPEEDALLVQVSWLSTISLSTTFLLMAWSLALT